MTWSTTTTDPRALQVPDSSNRVAAVWYSATSFTVAVNLNDGKSHDLELYFDDWDSSGRAETVQISNAAGTVLSTESISSFTKGIYLDWQVSGDLVITFTRTGGNNAVLNGLFLDPATAAPAISTVAPIAPAAPTVPALASVSPAVSTVAPLITTETGSTPTSIVVPAVVSSASDATTSGTGRRRHPLHGHPRGALEVTNAKRARRTAAALETSKRRETLVARRGTASANAAIHDLALEQIPGRGRRPRLEH